jgi:hypothetical protein
MKHIILIFVSVFLLAACGAQNTTQVVTDIVIDLAVEPSPPAVGAATLLITVSDSNGTAIDGATVAVIGNMDHVGMAAVAGEATQGVDGVYAVPFEWTMGGGWILDVTVILPDNRGIATARFEEFVGAVSSESIVNRTPTPHN